MSIFIEASNQSMLWNTMQKLDLFQTSFFNENEKMNWFKMVIANIYERNKALRLTNDDLHVLNRETIKYMIQILKSQQNSQKDSQSKPKIQIMKNSDPYEALKEEYESMRKPSEPPNRPDFSEPIDDIAIENIGELIEKQKNERARDLSSHNIETVELNDEDLKTVNNKKSVSWNDETQSEQIVLLTNRIEQLEQRMEKLNELVENLVTDQNINTHVNQFSF